MLTENDINRLADAVTARQKHQTCPLGLTPAAVAMVNAMAQAWETGKKTAVKTATGIIITAVFGLVALGFKHYINRI